MKNYQAAIYNETNGLEWLGTISQERPALHKDFISDAMAFAFNEMGLGGCDCATVTIKIGTDGDIKGNGMNEIFDILLTTRIDGSSIIVDVRYYCNSGLHYVREMVMAE